MNTDNEMTAGITEELKDTGHRHHHHHHHHHHTNENGETAQKPSAAVKIVLSFAVVVVICAAALGIFALIQNIDYMRPVRDICSIYNNRETDTARIFKLLYSGSDKKAYSSAYKIIANSDSYYDYIDSMPATLEDYYRDNAASGGSDIRMKFDITGDKSKMDDSQLAIIYNEIEARADYYQGIVTAIDNMGKEDIQNFADAMGISYKRATQLCSIIRTRCESCLKYDISSGYYITGRFVLYNKNNDTAAKTEKLTLAIIKLNGKWCIYEGKSEGVLLATGIDSLADNDILWDICSKYIVK